MFRNIPAEEEDLFRRLHGRDRGPRRMDDFAWMNDADCLTQWSIVYQLSMIGTLRFEE